MPLGMWLYFWSNSLADGLRVEAELKGPGGGYTDISSDVLGVPSPSIDYGIQGAGPVDLVAGAGRMTFALKNDLSNSGGVVGYYSPENANCRPGFALGIGIRLTYRYLGVNYYKFVGTLDAIEPVPGLYRERIVLCSALDWMDEAARYRPTVETQVGKTADQVIQALIDAVPRTPVDTDLDVGDSTFTYALDNSQSEHEPVLTELQRIAQSEYGHVFITGSTTAGGVLKFTNRSSRLAPVVSASFNDDTLVGIVANQSRSAVINRVKATIHPRDADALPTSVLFVNNDKPSLASGASVTIVGSYTDQANREARVGGFEMVTPASTTDYTANTQEDGLGTSLTASFTVSAEYGANQVKYTITNGSTQAGFLTSLQARGRGLYDYSPIQVESASTSSITAYGENQLVLDMPDQSEQNTALAVAEFIRDTWSSPHAIEVTARYIANTRTGENMAEALGLEPGDAIGATETVTGVAQTYWINHVSQTYEPGFISTEYLLSRALSQNFWTLDSTSYSQLDQTTIPAPL